MHEEEGGDSICKSFHNLRKKYFTLYLAYSKCNDIKKTKYCKVFK